MNYSEIKDFFDKIDEHSEQEILTVIQYINENCRSNDNWLLMQDFIAKIFKHKNIDKSKILYELFKNKSKFFWWGEKLDIPEKLKFGIEIEVANLSLDTIRSAFESNNITDILTILGVPTDISNQIIQNSDFEKKNEPDKWIFSREGEGLAYDESEASSPILSNNVFDLNQIVAICTLLKALNAQLHGGTGLHINLGVDYLECNEKAIENILRIWGECEELFFKMANREGETIRSGAHQMATPIKENIQDFFETDGSITLKTEEDMVKFLYQIQARNRMDTIIGWSDFGKEPDLEYELYCAKTDEQRFKVYKMYNDEIKKRADGNDKVRFTSINFNHMEWNSDTPGRIEIRIFNSSLDPEIIFQDLLLVGKIFEVSLRNAKDSNYKKGEFDRLILHNVTEDDKVDNLLKLLFDKAEQRTIFKKRWQSVNKKDYKIYESGKDTFER